MPTLDFFINMARIFTTFFAQSNTHISVGQTTYKYIPPVTGSFTCPPMFCSNGTFSFDLRNPHLVLDQFTTCPVDAVVHNRFLGDIPLEPNIYCNFKNLRFIPGYTCCSPRSPDESYPKLYLFTPGSLRYYTQPIELVWFDHNDRLKLPSTGDIVFLIHGYAEMPIPSGNLWVDPAIQAWTLIQRKPVVLVQYTFGTFQYFQTLANLRTVGMAVGYALLNWGITDRSIVVGASLGGQVLSEVGKYTKKHGKLIKHCIATDPAGPTFDSGQASQRLTPDDCRLVQVVHSSSEFQPNNLGILRNELGTFYHSGHCDFWLNCGRAQGSGCQNPTIGAMMHFVPSDRLQDSFPVSCDHYRAHVLHSAIVGQKCNYIGIECADCAHERPYDGCFINLNGSTMSLPPFNDCKPGDRKDFYVYLPGNIYPYCANSPYP